MSLWSIYRLTPASRALPFPSHARRRRRTARRLCHIAPTRSASEAVAARNSYAFPDPTIGLDDCESAQVFHCLRTQVFQFLRSSTDRTSIHVLPAVDAGVGSLPSSIDWTLYSHASLLLCNCTPQLLQDMHHSSEDPVSLQRMICHFGITRPLE